MSRADELRAKYEAEIAMVELEDELIAAKDSGDVSRDLKLQVREARRVFREQRAGDPVAEGDAVASPEPIAVKAEVQEV